MFQFDPSANHDTGGSLIPVNTLTFATFKVQKLRQSSTTGGRYADVELVLQGQFENRRVFDKIPDPSDKLNSEKWRQMGMGAMQQALECAGIFDPARPESYARFASGGFVDILTALDGKRVAFKVGVEKGTDGHQDKNRVVTYLSPNPASSSNKQYQQLVAGGGAAPAPAQATTPAPSFAVAATPAPQTAPAPAPAAVGGAAPSWMDQGLVVSDDDIPF